MILHRLIGYVMAIITAALVSTLFLAAIYGQPVFQNKPAAEAKVEAMKLTELEHLTLRRLIDARQSTLKIYNLTFELAQYVAQPQLKMVQADATTALEILNNFITAMFKQHNVDIAKFNINAETGEFEIKKEK